MNVLNRTIVIVEILALAVLLVVAAVVPNPVLERLLYTVQQAQGLLLSRWPASYVFFLLIAVVLMAVLVLLLWLELRPQGKKTVAVRNIVGTKAEVSTSSVEQSLQYRISELPEVLKVRPTVRGKRSGVDVMLDIETTPEIDIPAKMAEVSQAARDVVEGKMGLRVAKIQVNIRHGRYGKVKPPSSVPAQQPVTTFEPAWGPAPEQPPAQPPTAPDNTTPTT